MADLKALTDLMDRLLAEDGCPWDRAQDHHSLRPHLIEEAYEVLDAIERENPDLLKEELGDLLYQIVFHAALAERSGAFDMAAVIDGIVDKMRYRHPHVFGEEVLDADDPRASWDALKSAEQGEDDGFMSSLPSELPALMKAEAFIRKARNAGFEGSMAELLPKAPPEIQALMNFLEKEGRGQMEVLLNESIRQGIQDFRKSFASTQK